MCRKEVLKGILRDLPAENSAVVRAQHLDLHFTHDQFELGNQIPHILRLSSIFYLYFQYCFSYICAELLY